MNRKEKSLNNGGPTAQEKVQATPLFIAGGALLASLPSPSRLVLAPKSWKLKPNETWKQT
jgi:hypothetical protein